MQIKINFTNINTAADGVRVYRSTSVIDPANLPAVLDTLPGNATSYTDLTVVKDQLYYYMFEVFKGTEKVLSANVQALADFYSGPGNQVLKSGDLSAGYYGVIPSSDFTDWDTVVSWAALGGTLLGANTSTPQDWVKFVHKGKILFVPRQPLGQITWQSLYLNGLVFGTNDVGPRTYNAYTATNQMRTITIQGSTFKVRLMRGLPEGADLTRNYSTATGNSGNIASNIGNYSSPETYDTIWDLTGSEWNDLVARCLTWRSSSQKKAGWDRLDNLLATTNSNQYTGMNNEALFQEILPGGTTFLTRGRGVTFSYHPGWAAPISTTNSYYWRPVLEML